MSLRSEVDGAKLSVLAAATELTARKVTITALRASLAAAEKRADDLALVNGTLEALDGDRLLSVAAAEKERDEAKANEAHEHWRASERDKLNVKSRAMIEQQAARLADAEKALKPLGGERLLEMVLRAREDDAQDSVNATLAKIRGEG